LVCQAALPVMEQGGSIVFISSVAGLTPGSQIPSYDASKAGVIGLCRHVAMEGARKGVRANVVAPGLIDTPIGRLATAGRPNRAKTLVPLGRQGTAEEVAGRVDVSPPAFDKVADATAFPLCPAALFDGARQFVFEEPYQDVQGLGHFEYPDPFCDANHNGRWDGIYISGGVDHVAQQIHDA